MGVFKKDFLWGGSVSAMQTEGAWDEDGKGKSVYDIRTEAAGISDWKVAIDTYHRYEEDNALLAELGFHCYRFSISWSRIFPEGKGTINEQGLAFYDRFIDDLLAREIEPMICLYHFDMPLKLAEEYNGFLSREVVDYFTEYAKVIVDRYKDKVKYWLTFNEQNIFGMEHAFKISGCQCKETERKLYQIQYHTFLAHAKVVNYIHAVAPACKVGGMIAYQLFYPATCKPEDVFFAHQADERFNQLYWEVFTNGKYTQNMLAYFAAENCKPEMVEADLVILAKSKSDFLSFSYYASKCISFAAADKSKPFFRQVEQAHVANSYLPANAWNWEIDPLGFRLILDKTYQQYKLPLFPIENGIGWDEVWDGTQPIDDSYRIDYHRSHIQAMQQAIESDGVDVLGYLTWAPIDILSSQGEMKKRYGFVYVNRDEHDLKDLSRIPKRSFAWMKKVATSNGLDLE